jgi:hypothetical protein
LVPGMVLWKTRFFLGNHEFSIRVDRRVFDIEKLESVVRSLVSRRISYGKKSEVCVKPRFSIKNSRFSFRDWKSRIWMKTSSKLLSFLKLSKSIIGYDSKSYFYEKELSES